MATNNNAADSGVVVDDDPNDSFYGEAIFDDMIAKVMDAADKNNAKVKVKSPSPVNMNIVVDGNSRTNDANNVDDNSKVSADEDDLEIGGGMRQQHTNKNTMDNDESTNTESDAASLDSIGDISGKSNVSDLEKEDEGEALYISQPLVNDDESTIDMRPPAPETQTVSSYVDQLNQQERRKEKMIKAAAFSILVAIIIGVVLAVVTLTGNNDEPTGSLDTFDYSSLLSPGPTMQPAIKTTPYQMSIQTVHPIQLTLDNIPDDYRMSDDTRTTIISYVDSLISDNIMSPKYLGSKFELLDVTYGHDAAHDMQRRRLKSIDIPLHIVVVGPSNISQVAVRAKVIKLIQDESNDITNYLRAYDYQTFNDVRLSAGLYDEKDLIPPTSSPTLPPQSEQPTSASPSLLSPQTSSTSPETTEPGTSPTPPPQMLVLQLPTGIMTTVLETSSPTQFSPQNAPTSTNQPTTRQPSRPKPVPTPTTSYPTTREPITSEPTNQAPVSSLPPSRNPTSLPTPRPTLRPSTPRPTPLPTRRPQTPVTELIGPQPIGPYGSAAGNPSPPSNPTPPTSGINQGPNAPLPVGESNEYYCANVSYTTSWNIKLDFDCDRPCPSKVHTACPGGHQCHVSEYCVDT